MWWMLGLILLTAVALVVWYLRRVALVQVPETEVAVVYADGGRRFVRFLTAGNHWLRPFREQVGDFITTDATAVQGRTTGLQTVGGIAVTVEWRLAYEVNLAQVPPGKQFKAARTHTGKAPAIIRSHVGNVLQHIVSEYSLEHLTRTGAPKQLEAEVKTAVAQRLHVLGFAISRVMVNAIELPPHVKSALEAAHERQMQAEHEALALARLQRVVSQFSDADMQRLIELERIRHLGQHSVILPYPAPTYAPSNHIS
jgi:regulator of protease activity HflC (stomatin/prohibitin superfamily)